MSELSVARKWIKEKPMPNESDTTTYKNAALEVWQFIHDIKPGDIIITKKGTKTVHGRGVVTSEFIYDVTTPKDFKIYVLRRFT